MERLAVQELTDPKRSNWALPTGGPPGHAPFLSLQAVAMGTAQGLVAAVRLEDGAALSEAVGPEGRLDAGLGGAAVTALALRSAPLTTPTHTHPLPPPHPPHTIPPLPPADPPCACGYAARTVGS
jgi:hypothetical protein